MGTLPGSPLGKATVYADRYDPALLYAVERAPQRDALGIGTPLPFTGADAWTAWEGNWLDADDKPRVAVVRFDVPAESPAIIESKSVKLYFTALNDTRFASAADYASTLRRDLSAAAGADVAVRLIEPDAYAELARTEPSGECLDHLPLRARHAAPARELLKTSAGDAEQTLYTRLFRSLCPVTGQPDYATVEVAYRGRRIDAASLLEYLVAYRRHPGFHEHCVERIYCDIGAACAPVALGVVARFTRRGGIDINPWRRNGDLAPAATHTLVQ